MTNIRVCIKDSDTGEIYKFLKIIPFKDGGFAVVLPTVGSSKLGQYGYTERQYDDRGDVVSIKQVDSSQFSHDDTVKFSYHQDGFTQFSSAGKRKIRSGRNEDGSSKSLGVVSWPIEHPIASGPSIAVGVWGLSKLERFIGSQDSCFILETIKVKNHPEHPVTSSNIPLYCLDIHLHWPDARFEKRVSTVANKEYILYGINRSKREGFVDIRGTTTLRLLRLPNQPLVLGLDWFAVGIEDAKGDSYGFTFGGPSKLGDDSNAKDGLNAFYPIDSSIAKKLLNLSYES